MEIARIQVSGVQARAVRKLPAIPAKLVGGYITLEYTDSLWEGLTKTVVFRSYVAIGSLDDRSEVVKDIVTNDTIIKVPPEVLEKPGRTLEVGFFGTRSDDTVAIPTFYAKISEVREATDPSGDESTNPALPVYAQLAERVEALEKGGGGSGGVGPQGPAGADGDDGGYYSPSVSQPDANTVEFSFAASKGGMPAVEPVKVELPCKEAVLYSAQELTQEQKVQARMNISAANADDVNAILEEVPPVNILPPDYQMGYWDTVSNSLITTTDHCTTVNPIPVDAGKILYITWSEAVEEVTNKLFCAIFFDANGEKIGSAGDYFGLDRDSAVQKRVIIPAKCTHMHFWLNSYTTGLRLEHMCLSYSRTTTYVPYEATGRKAIKTSALNESALNILSPLYGKTVVNFGDSIFGMRRPPDDISTELAKLTGAVVHNCGFGGGQMQVHWNADYAPFSMCSLADAIVSGDWTAQDASVANVSTNGIPSYFPETLEILKSLDFSKVDVITIAYGTNDFTNGGPLDNEDEPTDASSFAGALRYSIEKLLTAYPHLKIFICCQTYRFWQENGVITDDSDTHIIYDKKLTDYVAKTKEVAEAYHLPYIDFYYSLGVNKFNRTRYFSVTDSTHPNTVGCHLIAAHMAKALF